MADRIDISGIVDFLKTRDEVSSVFVFGIRKAYNDPESELGIGVLMGDGMAGHAREDSLDMGGWDLSDDFPHWPVSVVLLNSAPSFLQHHVVRKGSVVFDRDRRHRLAFTERAINHYLDQLPDERFHYDHEPEIEIEGNYEDYDGIEG